MHFNISEESTGLLCLGLQSVKLFIIDMKKCHLTFHFTDHQKTFSNCFSYPTKIKTTNKFSL